MSLRYILITCAVRLCKTRFQVDLAKNEKCEFIPFQSPKRVIVRNKKITGIEFYRTEQNEEGEWVEDEEQTFKLKADFVISAFGSGLYDTSGEQFSYIN